MSEGGRPEAELEAMTYAGEETETVERLAGGHVAITSHRVHVLRTDEEPRYDEVALPNVAEAGVQTEGNRAAGLLALRRGVYAVVLFLASVFVDFGGMLDSIQQPDGGGSAASQVVGIALQIVELLRLVDEVLALAGLALAFVALVHTIQYARSRTNFFEIGVSGRDPVRVTIDRRTQATADHLAGAVEQASNALGE